MSFRCRARYWCRGTTLEVADSVWTETLTEMNVICQGEHACTDGVTIDLSNTEIQSFVLLCYSEFACDGMQINITSARMMDITILCDGEDVDEVWSCKEMAVTLRVPGGRATIGCLKKSVCDSLRVHVLDEGLTLSMQIYENSEDVKISHLDKDALEFVCTAPGITRFIMYQPAYSLSSIQLMRAARSEYESEVLPCDGIEVILPCFDSPSGKECEMEYVEADNMEQLEELPEAECYWIAITKLFAFELKCASCSTEGSSSSTALLSDINDLIIVVVAATIFVCLLLCFLICRARRKRQERIAIAMQSINVRNAMVVVVGIAGYEKKPKEPEFAGYLYYCSRIGGPFRVVHAHSAHFRHSRTCYILPTLPHSQHSPHSISYILMRILELYKNRVCQVCGVLGV